MSKMSIADAIAILHPDTSFEKLTEIEYYGGFNGHLKQMEAINEACLIACDAMKTRIGIEPKKEQINTGFSIRITYRCSCGKDLFTRWTNGGTLGEMSKYCNDCGQAIDWSDIKKGEH